jgi:hypothetical protein
MDITSFRQIAMPLQRRLVLDLLDRIVSLPLERIPAVWPLTREHTTEVVAGLVRGGSVSLEWDRTVPGRKLARLTPTGKHELRALGDASMLTELGPALANGTLRVEPTGIERSQ